MGKYYSDVVEQALQNIYYKADLERGRESFQRLFKASKEGDGDASCILARCLSGHKYVWKAFGFPVDEDEAEKLLQKAVMQRSAAAVLICMRTGTLTPELKLAMPFSSLREAFDRVLEIAEQGDAFCQYLIGNTYYWWDFLEIQGKSRESFSCQEEMRDYLIQEISKCEDWLWKAFRGGMYFAGHNLKNYYRNGEDGLIPPHPERVDGVDRIGAEIGYPLYEYFYGCQLWEQGKRTEAVPWFQRGLEHGDLNGWFYLGWACQEGIAVPKDLGRAVKCYENGTKVGENDVGCNNRLGVLYYHGEGVSQNYDRAFQYLYTAWKLGSKYRLNYLGKCYFYGLGTVPDHRLARECLEKYQGEDPEVNYILGCIYGQGLGVSNDIKKAVQYLQRARNFPRTQEELSRYKKTLFGKWVRR